MGPTKQQQIGLFLEKDIVKGINDASEQNGNEQAVIPPFLSAESTYYMVGCPPTLDKPWAYLQYQIRLPSS